MISTHRYRAPMLFGVLAVLWLGSAFVANAAIYVVPSDFGTIQAAIVDNSVGAGDVIIVSEGIYLENVDFLGKAIILRSTDPNNPEVVANTIIDGSAPMDPNRASVVSFVNAEGASSVISGFTLQNGLGQTDSTIGFDRSAIFTGSNGDGGAVLCRASSPTITKNVFKNNSSLYGGGAIFCHNQASPEISKNTFINNTTVSYGGAIFCRINCQPIITRNTFVQNSCGSLGGAIYLADHSDARIVGNWFESNSSTQLSGGAIYYFVSSNPTIANNIFWKNTARTTGSAIMVSGSTGEIFNNTFFENRVLADWTCAISLLRGKITKKCCMLFFCNVILSGGHICGNPLRNSMLENYWSVRKGGRIG